MNCIYTDTGCWLLACHGMGVLCVVWVRGVPEGVVGQARGLTQEHAGLPPHPTRTHQHMRNHIHHPSCNTTPGCNTL